METKNNELEMFISYYEKAKAEQVINHEFNILKSKETNDDEIKDFAQGKTIVYIEEYYNIHTPVFAYSVAATTGAGVMAGLLTKLLVDGKIDNPVATLAIVGASVGTAIATEFAILKSSKAAKEYDKNAQKAAEMTKAIKEHRKQDQSILVDTVFRIGNKVIRTR